MKFSGSEVAMPAPDIVPILAEPPPLWGQSKGSAEHERLIKVGDDIFEPRRAWLEVGERLHVLIHVLSHPEVDANKGLCRELIR